MDWFPWYFTLYEQDTMHLNPYQDGCYRRLIDHYMKTRVALPDNDAALARIIGDSEANWVAMASPLVRPFFKSKNGRLYLKRCEEILTYQDNKARNLSESGKKGAEKRWNKNNNINSHPMATPMGSAIAQDRTGHIQDSKKEKNIEPPVGVSLKIWEDFKKHRKAKKAPITETVISGIQKEADIAGWTLEQAMAECCVRGWQSFKAEWINKGEQNGKTKSQLADEAGQRALRRLEEQEAATLRLGSPVV